MLSLCSVLLLLLSLVYYY